MDNQLTVEDIEILINSIDAWMNKESTTNLMVMMLDIALVPIEKRNDPEYMKKREQDRKEMQAKQEQEMKNKNERGILLKAKLIQMKDKLQIEGVIK